ncbi:MULTISPECIES: hypothetical protein [unclassified Streptomyces]|uniref:hypothetical protein n=1 Tax=unclassified Streptomyces TaxID=2593676 RepID=UPI0003A8C7A4|nr:MULTISPECIES: hypothetical protein [unclassified Streptomyces]MYX37821.1 hypothetical protein [Streptomyces sp. SID8377]
MTTTEPGADERRIGMILRHFGVGYTPTGEADEETRPAGERTPRPRRWPNTPPLLIVGKAKPTEETDEGDPDDQPEEEPQRTRPVRRPRTRRPDRDPDTEDAEEDGEEEPKPKRTARRPKTRPVSKTKAGDKSDDEDEGEDGDEEEKRRPRQQRRPPFAAPGVPKRRKSLVASVRTMPGHQRWAIYNGAALGLGFAFGLPQFFTAETAYLVATSSSWADLNCLFWYAVTAGIAWLDWRTRGWWPGLALLLRVPAVSLVVGVLLYGDPT